MKKVIDFIRSPIWLIAASGFKISYDETLAKQQVI